MSDREVVVPLSRPTADLVADLREWIWDETDEAYAAPIEAADRLEALDLNPSPSMWPACSECKEAFRLERRMQMHMEGESWQIRPIWAWMRSCKHKKADAVIYNNDGPLTIETNGEIGEVAL